MIQIDPLTFKMIRIKNNLPQHHEIEIFHFIHQRHKVSLVVS